MRILKALASFAAFLSMTLALPVSASVVAQVTGSTDVNAGVNGAGIDVNTNVGTKSSSITNPSAANKASSSAANASARAKVRANARSAVAVTASTATSGPSYNTYNGSTSGANASSTMTFVITRRDVLATSTGYIAPANVTSASDFATYSRALMMTDDNITKIAANDNQVAVYYNEPVKILGVIPVSATIQAMVDANGNVTVTYPWWYDVFVKDTTKASLQTDINNTAGTIARGEATTTLSSTVKARLVNALQSILKTRYETVSGTSTDVNTY